MDTIMDLSKYKITKTDSSDCIRPAIDTKPKIIDEMTIEEFEQWKQKQPIVDGDRVEVKLGGCDEWFKGTVIRARKQEIELDQHEYIYPKIADETNIVGIRFIVDNQQQLPQTVQTVSE